MRGELNETGYRHQKTVTALAVVLCAATLIATSSMAQEPQVIPAPDIEGGGLMLDSYLWHVRGLPPGQRLPVYSGAGPNFRIIHALDEGTPIERLSCRDSRGGYWCRVATVDLPASQAGWMAAFCSKNPALPHPTTSAIRDTSRRS